MSVQDGQRVNAAIVNAALASRTVDTSLAGVVDFTNTAESTDLVTGAVKVLGGAAVTKNLNVGGAIGAPTGNIADVNATTVDVTTLNATDANVADDLIVSGDTTVQAMDAVSVVTDSLTVNNDSLISGDSTVSGELNVTGDSNLSVVNASDINTTGNVIIGGDLTVNGTTTTVNSATLEVTDANVLVNNGGNDTTAQGAGLTVERTTVNGALEYDSALASKFKIGNVGSLKEVVTVSDAQELSLKSHVQPSVKQEASTPSAPSPGYWKIYPKSDGYYQQDNLGNETRFEPLSASSSQKGIIDLATQILGDKSKIVQDMIGGTTDVDSSTTGSDQSVASLKTLVKFTNASLASINRIEHPPGFAHSFIKVLTFNTGSNVVIKHNAGSPASHRIFTQDGNDNTVSNGTSLFVMYDEDSQAWRIIGESGGTGSSSQKVNIKYGRTGFSTGSGDQTLIYDSLNFDANSDYNNTTGVFTAPYSGEYMVIANTFSSTNFANQQMRMYIYKNGTSVEADSFHGGQTGSNTFNTWTIGGLVQMNAGDTFEIRFDPSVAITLAGGFMSISRQ